MKELLLGAGMSRAKKLSMNGPDWHNLTTIDIDQDCNPDINCDLELTPWPLPDDEFDEVHAYEILEHLGQQGDYQTFFDTFNEIYRVLKPGGHLIATTPAWNGRWAWGDPGHTRIINEGTISFLDRPLCLKDRKDSTSPRTNYFKYWYGDFEIIHSYYDPKTPEIYQFVLRAHKPGRC